jgi:ferric enterobactin receptor
MINNSMRTAAIAAGICALFGAAPLAAQHETHTSVAPTQAMVDVVGRVLCADGPPLPGAIVQIFSGTGASAKLRSATLSDERGAFRFRLPHGEFTLQVAFLGHAASLTPISISGSKRTIDLDAVTLDVNAIEIEALVATGERDRVQLRAGSTVIDPQRAVSSAGGSVEDLLRTIPGLDVDADGQLTIRGSASVLVLLNGRPVPLKAAALSAFLKQLPAAALTKVEVGTAVSAAHDAQGAGVVSLEMRTAAGNARGFSVSAAAATARQYNAAVRAHGTVHALSWDASYALSVFNPVTRTHTTRDNFLTDDALRTSHQDSRALANHQLHAGELNGVLQVGNRSNLTARFGYSWMRGAYDNATTFVNAAPSARLLTTSALRHTIPTADASVGWSFRDPGGLGLNSEVRFTRGSEFFDGNYRTEDAITFLATDMDYARREWTVGNDATFDLGGTSVAVGHKLVRRNLQASYVSNRGGSRMVDDYAQSDVVSAFYASAGHTLGTALLNAGLRVEGHTRSLHLNARQEPQLRSTRMFPSLIVQWPRSPDDAAQYQVSYARRIERPDAASLNPFSMGEDDMNSFIGNPGLRPEVTDQIELSTVRHLGTAVLRLSPYVSLTRDPIRAIKAVSESGHATTTLQNLDRARSAGLDANVKVALRDGVDLMVSSRLAYMQIRDQTDRAGLNLTLRGTLDLRLAANTSAQLYAYRYGAQAIAQGEVLPGGRSAVSLTHRFGADGRARLTLRVNDPVGANRLAFHMADATFQQHSVRTVSSRMIALSFNWATAPSATDTDPVEREEKQPRIF